MKGRTGTEQKRVVARLTLQLTAFIVALLALLGVLVYTLVASSASESAQRTLMNATQIDSPRDAPLGVFVAVSAGGQLMVSRNMPAGLPDLAAIAQAARTGATIESQSTIAGHSYAILTAPHEGRVVQAAIDRHQGDEELARLAWALLVAMVAAAIATGFVAYVLARRATRPLSEALALQRRFVADASHELRTPLTLLSTRAQLLKRRLAQTDASTLVGTLSRGVGEIVEDSKVLTEILEDLLISVDPRESTDPVDVDLGAAADEALAALDLPAQQKGLALRREGPVAPVSVVGARVPLQRVFTALITNALDHASSRVEVEVFAKGHDAVIRVSDDGTGFPPEVGQRAFERFASSRPVAGEQSGPRHYGLGLALVADVVANHGGSVQTGPGPSGGGASVTVRLPLARKA
ncbi:sensor histidine kinase [Pseudarthrobacter sp. P1]|uniref:sensor histidine kinase n=1 Tax=Pseudarthrobacter sp. P1 TaxID=3418418 RepID=UPI003CF1D450